MIDEYQNTNVDREIGELNGRMSAVEREQENLRDSIQHLHQSLDGLKENVNILSKRISWLFGGIAVLVALAGSLGWYMAKAGIAPLDDIVAVENETE